MRELPRRDFLKLTASALLTAAAAALAAPAAWAEKFYREPPWRRKKPYWGFGVDIEKCIGCARCVDACKTENDVPREPFYFRTWVERYIIRKDNEIKIDAPNGGLDGYPPVADPETVAKSFFVPKLCNLCESSPCVQVCPVGATFKTEDGVVLIDKKYCIGCRYCIQACPYGTRYFHPVLQVADKCSVCYHRLKRGMVTACVEVCPTGARMVGDLSDPESNVTKFRENNKVQTLKANMGTEPKLVYKGLDKEVR
ncbi:MAG: 4Fe-4S dicluster domain-containing protein [Elusimicrobia bacterium]|nr:4Fe-4S dicluster domain-containing protein [Elusimicrobiota bacterium]